MLFRISSIFLLILIFNFSFTQYEYDNTTSDSYNTYEDSNQNSYNEENVNTTLAAEDTSDNTLQEAEEQSIYNDSIGVIPAITNNLTVTNIITVSNISYVTIPSIETINPNICLAIINENLDDVQKYLKDDPNSIYRLRGDGNSLLHIAATTTNAKILQFLIDKGVNINQTNTAGRTPLHTAVQQNNVVAAQLLINNNINLRIKDKQNQTAAWIASIKGYPQLLKILTEAQKIQTNTPLLSTDEEISLSTNKQLFITVPKDFSEYSNFINAIVNTPIPDSLWHKALYVPGIQKVKKLINLNYDPNTKDQKGMSALHIATYYNNQPAVEYLLSLPQTDITVTDHFGNTALHTAAGKSSSNIVQLLINSGLNIQQKNKRGWTPLFEATLLGNVDVVRFLLSSGVSPNISTYLARTPIHEASRLGYTFIVRDLLTFGSKYNHQDYQGKTPLFLAVENGHINIIELLKNQAVNPNIVDFNGNHLINAAIRKNRVDIIQYLLNNFDIDLNITDSLGQTPIDIAYISASDKIIELLANYSLTSQSSTIIPSNSEATNVIKPTNEYLDSQETIEEYPNETEYSNS